MKYIKGIAYLLVLVSGALYAGERESSGGSITKMLEAELKDKRALTINDIEKIVSRNGSEVKEKILIPVLEKFFLMNTDKLSNELKIVQSHLKTRKAQVVEDIRKTKIEFGHCEYHSACTKDKVGATIYLDRDVIKEEKFGVSFSELSGILIHEYLHHHMVNIPSHDDYHLARLVKRTIQKNEYNEKTYSIIDSLYLRRHTSWKYLYQGDPNLFCQYKGHKDGAKKYVLSQLTGRDASRLGVLKKWRNQDQVLYYTLRKSIVDSYEVDNLGVATRKKIQVYKSITCFISK